MTHPLSDEDRISLGQLCTRDHAGRHFTETRDADWLDRMEAEGLIAIDRPGHQATGIPYDQAHWSVTVSPEVAGWFDDYGNLID